MRGPRQKRTVPSSGRHIRLTERDREILESVAKMRFTTTRQLARLHFEGSRESANKRLRKLLDGGFLRVWLRDLAQDNIYGLTPPGVRLLNEDSGNDPGEGWSAPRGLVGNIDHLLAINQVRVSLAVSLPEAVGEIAWWRSDWELRAEARAKLIPDALFGVAWQEHGEQTFLLEMDYESRSSRGLLKKILGYSTLAHRRKSVYGALDFLILVVGRDPRLLERYRQTLAGAGIAPESVWVTALAELEGGGALAEVWRSASGPESHSLRDLATLPYGKEGQAA